MRPHPQRIIMIGRSRSCSRPAAAILAVGMQPWEPHNRHHELCMLLGGCGEHREERRANVELKMEVERRQTTTTSTSRVEEQR